MSMSAVAGISGRHLSAFAQSSNSINVNPKLPVIPSRKFLITDYGAIGDGKGSNTEAFRKTIAALKAAGGGEVIVPIGTYITGPIQLAGNTALVIEKGATIRGSQNFADYETTDHKALPLIGGKNLTKIATR